MLPIQSFNPANFSSGNGAIDVGAADAGSKILFYNESPFNLEIDFFNGNMDVLHAWEARWWPLDGDTKQLEWTIDSAITSSSAPISKVMGVLYGPYEQLPGTYPVNLFRQTNVGNVINTVGGVANAVQNDGNPPATSVIEATVAADIASAVVLLNSGKLYLGTIANDGYFQVQGSSGMTFIDTSGNLNVSNGGRARINLIQANAGNDLGFHVGLGQRIVDTINGVDTFSVNGAGANLLAGTLKFLAGSISRFVIFTGTSATGKVTVAHNLGVVPDAIFLCFADLTSTPVTTTLGYNSGTLTTTNVDVWSSFGGVIFVGIAIKA